jgi:ABC-2 type transport system ATP-binding protein
VLALLGPNGAGKSTSIALMLGLATADDGRVQLFDRDPRELDARAGIGVMLQTTGIPETLKVRELIEVTRSYYANPRSIADCVALAGLDGLLERRYGRLSGGQQRRVQFAMAVCGRPKLLFLDEPTTGLDIDARQKLWAAIRELVADGAGVGLTSHYVEEAEALADRVVVVNGGRVVAQGSVAQIRARVGQRRVRCVSSLDAAHVAAWPHVLAATRDGARLEVVADAIEAVVYRLLTDDPTLSDLEVTRAGLADAFVEITKEAA